MKEPELITIAEILEFSTQLVLTKTKQVQVEDEEAEDGFVITTIEFKLAVPSVQINISMRTDQDLLISGIYIDQERNTYMAVEKRRLVGPVIMKGGNIYKKPNVVTLIASACPEK